MAFPVGLGLFEELKVEVWNMLYDYKWYGAAKICSVASMSWSAFCFRPICHYNSASSSEPGVVHANMSPRGR